MIRISNLTLAALLDHVETHLLRWARGRANLPPRAYAADAEGVVTVLGFPVPADDAGREALGAILELEMQRRQAVMVVLALPSWASLVAAGQPVTEAGSQEVLLLDGRALRGAPGGAAQATRILVIERRRDRRITRLAPLAGDSTNSIGDDAPVRAAKA